ncbi:hypothetical protein [Aquariibacter albus]|uniref:Uncharacterized protein n=1 Tax=Aquariibacter albus TaxID=2759899 RepID=A0A839HHU8_9BURK|nr:hypothetical protein [Aquariibacter albus]MBB1160966.1 hypothetical protein [Aquariibacter albus]
MSAAACDDLQSRLLAVAELAGHAAGHAALLLDDLNAAPLPEDHAASERMIEALASGLALVGWCADAAATLGGQPPTRDSAAAWLLRPDLADRMAALRPLASGALPAAAPAGRSPRG